MRGKPKERAEKYRALKQKWKRNKKITIKQVLDGASDAKCQTGTQVIEAMYTERFKSVGPMVDLLNYLGPVQKTPVPSTTSEKSQQRQASPRKSKWPNQTGRT